MRKISGFVVAAALGLGLALSCGGSNKVKPDDMSAEEHRKEASKEYAAAHREMESYDPGANKTVGVTSPELEKGGPPLSYPVQVYNPTAHHLEKADAHRRHAQEHEAAAAELEKYEDFECAQFPAETRAACPVLGDVVRIDDVPGGVRIQFDPSVPVPAVAAHMRCHLAYARTHGYKGVEDCPLYLKGVSISTTSDPHAVFITSDDPKVVPDVRKRTREEAIPASPGGGTKI